MGLIPYAGRDDEDQIRPRAKVKAEKFRALANLSLRSEFNSLAARYKKLRKDYEDLKIRNQTLISRAEDLQRTINKVEVIVGGPRIDENIAPFAAKANKIVMAVADFYGLTYINIVGRRRDRQITDPRHLAIYLVSELVSPGLAGLGRYFGGRDHTTIIHAIQRVKRCLKEDPKLVADVAAIQAKLRSTE